MCYQQRPENMWIPLCFRECSFLSKTVKAEEVGARAIIVANQDPESDEFYIEMINDNTSREVHIPAGFLLGKNGYVCWHQTFPNCVGGFQGSYRYLSLKTVLWLPFVQIWNLILTPVYCSWVWKICNKNSCWTLSVCHCVFIDCASSEVKFPG